MIQRCAVFINNWTGPTVSSHGLVSMTVFNIFDQALVVSGRRQGQGPMAANDLMVEVRVKLGLRCFGGRGRGSGGLGGLLGCRRLGRASHLRGLEVLDLVRI